jgi:hypothetical protein
MRTATVRPAIVVLMTVLAGVAHVHAQGVQAAYGDGPEGDSANVVTTSPCECGGQLACGCGPNDDAGWGGSLWTVTADALLLERRDPAAVVWAENLADPTQRFDAADFHFGFQAGVDVSVARHLGCDSTIEIRYFGIDAWNATSLTSTTPGDLLQVNAAVPVFTLSGDAISTAYASQLHNTEINSLRRLNDRLSLLAGFRYTELDEHASATLVNSAVPFTYDSATRNRLFGFQLGGQATLWNQCGPFVLEACGKAGIFNNSAAQNSAVRTGLVTLPATGRDDCTAFIGEVGITGTCQLTDRLALRGGYRLLWIDGVALASDQLPVSDFANNAGFNGSGDAFYHGAFAGLEYAW